jgi:hypothetical protein
MKQISVLQIQIPTPTRSLSFLSHLLPLITLVALPPQMEAARIRLLATDLSQCLAQAEVSL